MRYSTAIFLLVVACVAIGVSEAMSDSTGPIIGVLGVPATAGGCDTFDDSHIAYPDELMGGEGSCFATVYTKWIEMAGGRVAPIRYNLNDEQLTDIFNSVNGVLFTGGGLSLAFDTTYYQTAQKLYDMVLKANQNGEHVPLWGTCMGFQLLNILVSNNQSVLAHDAFDSEDLPLALDFTSAAPSSRMFANAPKDVYTTLGTQPVTANLHHDGVRPDVFESNPALSAFFGEPLSTNKGRKGQEFVSTIEGISYPVYGTQWHPERPEFEWTPDLDLNHSPQGLLAMQYMGNFFMSEARKNDHAFPSPTAEGEALIYNYAPTTGPSSYQMYVFPAMPNSVPNSA